MFRRRFLNSSLFACAVIALFPPLALSQPKKVWRIGVLESLPLEANTANFSAFRDRMSALGYQEGVNFVIEYRSSEGHGERFGALAKELVAAGVDLLLVRGTPAALAAKQTSSQIPIVMFSAEPFAVVTNLSRPEANVTGFSNLLTDMYTKRMEVLRELMPHVAKVGVLTDQRNPTFPASRREIEKGSAVFGLQVVFFDTRTAEDIELTFRKCLEQEVQALIISSDGVNLYNRQLIADLAKRYRLPTTFSSREFVDAGGLLSLGTSYPSLYHRAADFVDKILRGTRPSELPIEQPTKFELTLNAKTAGVLELPISPSLLARADEVVER